MKGHMAGLTLALIIAGLWAVVGSDNHISAQDDCVSQGAVSANETELATDCETLLSARVSSNRIELQELQPTSAGVPGCSARQGERDLSMELSMTSSLRMQAVRATFFGLPAVRSRW